MRAARIGPTVWELDGPMPIENRSKTEMATGDSLWWLVDAVVCRGGAEQSWHSMGWGTALTSSVRGAPGLRTE